MAHRMFATNDQGGDAVQGKPDDPNTIAPKGSQDAGPSNAASVRSTATEAILKCLASSQC